MTDRTPSATPTQPAPIILCGPQAVGKTRRAESIANALGCERIVVDWNGRDQLRDGTLAITNAEFWWNEATNMVRELQADGQVVGLTQSGALVLVPQDLLADDLMTERRGCPIESAKP